VAGDRKPGPARRRSARVTALAARIEQLTNGAAVGDPGLARRGLGRIGAAGFAPGLTIGLGRGPIIRCVAARFVVARFVVFGLWRLGLLLGQAELIHQVLALLVRRRRRDR